MKRTTIALPNELAAALERAARRRGASVSEVARIALSDHLGLSTSRRRLPFANLGRSGTKDTSQRIDELVEREWRP